MYATLYVTVYAMIYVTMYVTVYVTSHGTVYATIYITLSVIMYVTVYVIIYLTLCIAVYATVYINVREYRRSTSNQKSTILEKLATKGPQGEKNKNKNTTQYVVDTTMRKKTTKNVNKIRALLQTTAVKTNRTSLFLNGNRNGHYNTKHRT